MHLADSQNLYVHFSIWLADVLLTRSTPPVPRPSPHQWDFLQSAEWVIEMQSIEKVHELMERYGFEIKAGAMDAARRGHGQNRGSSRCKSRTEMCMNGNVASLIEAIDYATFERFGFCRDWRDGHWWRRSS